MIPVPSGVRVWLATGPTDMRRGMNGLAIQVQETLRRDPHGGHLFGLDQSSLAIIEALSRADQLGHGSRARAASIAAHSISGPPDTCSASTATPSARVASVQPGTSFAAICYQLACQSQREQPHERALRRANGIRIRLGGEPGMLCPFPEKPRVCTGAPTVGFRIGCGTRKGRPKKTSLCNGAAFRRELAGGKGRRGFGYER
jgi:IS66 Orf2 like protein